MEAKFYAKMQREHGRCMARLAAIGVADDKTERRTNDEKEMNEKKEEKRGKKRKGSTVRDPPVTKTKRKHSRRQKSTHRSGNQKRGCGRRESQTPTSSSLHTSSEEDESSSEQTDSQNTESSEGERLPSVRRVSRGKKGKRQRSSPLGRKMREKNRHESSKRRRNLSTFSDSQGREVDDRKYQTECKKKRSANEQSAKIPTARPRKNRESEKDSDQRENPGEGEVTDSGRDQPTRKTYTEAQTKQPPKLMVRKIKNDPDPDECLVYTSALRKNVSPDKPPQGKLSEVGPEGVDPMVPPSAKEVYPLSRTQHSVATDTWHLPRAAKPEPFTEPKMNSSEEEETEKKGSERLLQVSDDPYYMGEEGDSPDKSLAEAQTLDALQQTHPPVATDLPPESEVRGAGNLPLMKGGGKNAQPLGKSLEQSDWLRTPEETQEKERQSENLDKKGVELSQQAGMSTSQSRPQSAAPQEVRRNLSGTMFEGKIGQTEVKASPPMAGRPLPSPLKSKPTIPINPLLCETFSSPPIFESLTNVAPLANIAPFLGGKNVLGEGKGMLPLTTRRVLHPLVDSVAKGYGKLGKSKSQQVDMSVKGYGLSALALNAPAVTGGSGKDRMGKMPPGKSDSVQPGKRKGKGKTESLSGEQSSKGVYNESGWAPPPSRIREICEDSHRFDPGTRAAALRHLAESPEKMRLWVQLWLKALLKTGSCSTRKVNHMLFNLMGIKVYEFVELFQGVDLTDAIVRATGLFPNEESARNYEKARVNEGLTGEAVRHPFAEIPSFLFEGGEGGKSKGGKKGKKGVSTQPQVHGPLSTQNEMLGQQEVEKTWPSASIGTKGSATLGVRERAQLLKNKESFADAVQAANKALDPQLWAEQSAKPDRNQDPSEPKIATPVEPTIKNKRVGAIGEAKEQIKEGVWKNSSQSGWCPAGVDLQIETTEGALPAPESSCQEMSVRRDVEKVQIKNQKTGQELETAQDESEKKPQREEEAHGSLAGGSIYTPSIQTPSEGQEVEIQYSHEHIMADKQDTTQDTSLSQSILTVNEGDVSSKTAQQERQGTAKRLDTSPERTINEPLTLEPIKADTRKDPVLTQFSDTSGTGEFPLSQKSVILPKQQKQKRKKGVSNRALTGVYDPVAEFAQQLREEVTIPELAGVYGLDYSVLSKAAQEDGDSKEKQGAIAELKTLRGIRDYLEKARQNIQRTGNVFSVHLRRLPTRLLEVEQRRMDLLQRGGHVSRSNYTNKNKMEMFRCPLPGCGGAVLNSTKIRQAFRPHCNAFHLFPEIIFAFHFEMARGWEIVCVPALKPGQPPPGLNTPGGGSQEAGGGGAASTLLDLHLKEFEGNTGPNISRKDKYRHSLNKGSSGQSLILDADLQEEGQQEKRPGGDQHTGVYCFSKGDKGEAILVDSWSRDTGDTKQVDNGNNTGALGSSGDAKAVNPAAVEPPEFQQLILNDPQGGNLQEN